MMIRLVKYVANIMISDVMIERCDAEEEYWLFLNQFLGMLLLVSGKNNELFLFRSSYNYHNFFSIMVSTFVWDFHWHPIIVQIDYCSIQKWICKLLIFLLEFFHFATSENCHSNSNSVSTLTFNLSSFNISI